ncbi:MAG: 30S ribosomal protein S8 [Candidatus Walczuchella monophlebidarum]
MYTDPIADFLTRIRNALNAEHSIVEIPSSKLKKEITKILFDQGLILSYKFEENSKKKNIKIALKYDRKTRNPVIKSIKRLSKPGLRKYSSSTNLPRVLNGLGIAIISTSQGVMTDKQARAKHVGGEVICHVY